MNSNDIPSLPFASTLANAGMPVDHGLRARINIVELLKCTSCGT